MSTTTKTTKKKKQAAGKQRVHQKTKIGTTRKPRQQSPIASSGFSPEIVSAFFMGIILLFVLVSRMQFLDIAMERDEGIYSYFGKLILEGKTPYIDFYEIRLPGIFYMYAILVGIFGFTIEGLAVGILLMTMGTTTMLYFIGKKLFDNATGVIIAATFALLSLSPEISGFTRQSEHIVIFWTAAALLMMLKAFESEKPLHFVLAGVLICLAFVTKANAIFFILLLGFTLVAKYLLSNGLEWRKMFINGLYYSAGVFGLFGLMCMGMIAMGTFDEMWFWAFEASSGYVSKISWEDGKQIFNIMFDRVMANQSSMWILAGLGTVLIFFTKDNWYKKILAPMILLFSLLTITPGLRFYGHYWLMTIPGIAILAGICFYSIKNITEKFGSKNLAFWSPCLFLLPLFWQFNKMGSYYFSPDHHQVLRDTYTYNPFPEAQIVGEFIKQRIQPGEPIAMFGSEPQLFIYSNSRSATKHAYFSYLMKDPATSDASKWQQEYMSEIESTKPKYFVYFDHQTSLLAKTNSDRSVINWFNQWVIPNYNRVGLVDIIPNQPAKYLWGAEQAGYQPQSQYKIYVYERK